jgi:heme-degrading monooxygenase HmoA
MFAVTRSYTGAKALIDAMEQRHTEVEKLITTVPGFVSYFAVRSGDSLTTVTVCDDRTGVDETTRRAAQWVKENLPDSKMAAPTVSAGEVFLSYAGAGHSAGASSAAHA